MLTITKIINYGAKDVPLKDSATFVTSADNSQCDVPRTTLVVPHLSHTEKQRAKRARARAQGKCITCASRRASPGLVTCYECRKDK